MNFNIIDMKKIIQLFVFVFISGFTSAQVTIEPMLAQGGLIMRDQLWQFSIVNQASAALHGRVELHVRDRFTQEPILVASSSSFIINIGANLCSVGNISPIQYSLIPSNSPAINAGILPVGNYKICYLLFLEGSDVPDLEHCQDFDADPLSPPMLVYPADSSILNISPEQLSWMPPTPGFMFADLKYDLLIVPILNGQNQAMAIQENIPVFQISNIANTAILFSSIMPNLVNDKWYAWQVLARDGIKYAGKSETWIFKTQQIVPEYRREHTQYVQLSANKMELGYTRDGVLNIALPNEANDSLMLIKIEAEDNNSYNNSSCTIPVILNNGMNLIQIDLNKVEGLQKHGHYIAKMTNTRGERYLLRFEWK